MDGLGRLGRGRGRRGISMIEVVLAAGGLSIVAMGVYSMWSSSQKVFSQTTALAQSQGDLRAALDDLVREVRMAGDGVPIPGAPGQLTRFWDGATVGNVPLSTSATAVTFLKDAVGAAFLVTPLNAGAAATSLVAGPIRDYGAPVAGPTNSLVLVAGPSWLTATVRSDIACCAADQANNRTTVQIQSLTPATTVQAGSRVSNLAMVKIYLSSSATDCRGGASFAPCVVRVAGLVRGWSGGAPDIVWGTPRSMASRVTALSFQYFDLNGTDITASVASNLQNIRRVRLTLTANVGPVGSPHGEALSLTGDAELRNV